MFEKLAAGQVEACDPSTAILGQTVQQQQDSARWRRRRLRRCRHPY
jgi:hypothetical protein